MKILDTETSGLGGNVCEIAMITVNENTFEIEEVLQDLVKPKCKISPSASGINHITNEMVEDAPPMESLLGKYTFKEGEYLVAHNAEFDVRVLEAEGMNFSGAKILCTLKLARALFDKSKFGDHKLGTLFYGYEIYKTFDYQGDSHRADVDCAMTAKVLKAMLTEYNLSLDEAYELVKPSPAYNKPCWLKKYKGQKVTWEELVVKDRPYLEWVHNNFTWKEDDTDQLELKEWISGVFDC